jgi:hypothetical protein
VASAAPWFAPDSLLEGDGFEPPVPRAIRPRFGDFSFARLRGCPPTAAADDHPIIVFDPAAHRRTPHTNGKAERFIQTSLREWAYAPPYVSSQQRRAALTTLFLPVGNHSGTASH